MTSAGTGILPDIAVLRRHLAQGDTPATIAARYGVPTDTVARRLMRAARGISDTPATAPCGHCGHPTLVDRHGIRCRCTAATGRPSAGTSAPAAHPQQAARTP